MKKKNTILIVLLGLIAIGLLAVYILPILAEAQQTMKEEHRGTVALVLVGKYEIIV